MHKRNSQIEFVKVSVQPAGRSERPERVLFHCKLFHNVLPWLKSGEGLRMGNFVDV